MRAIYLKNAVYLSAVSKYELFAFKMDCYYSIYGRASVSMGAHNGARAQTKRENIQLYPVDSSPYGIPFANWTGNWWKWALEYPKAKNPVSDVSAKIVLKDRKGQFGS